MPKLVDGNGATVTFGSTAGFFGVVTSIGSLRLSRGAIDNTGLADTADRVCPGKVTTSDEFELEYYCDSDFDPTVFLSADPELITITYPVGEGETNGATRTGQAFVTSISDPSFSNGTNPSGSMSIKFDGPITFTAGS